MLSVQRSEVGRIIPYSFSKIRQEQENGRDVDLGFSSPALSNKSTSSVKEDDVEEGLDYEEGLDLLTTVLAEVNIGYGTTLRPCDNDLTVGSRNDLTQDKSHAPSSLLSEPSSLMASPLSETSRNNIYVENDDIQPTYLEQSITAKPLSETFCDEIFDELEKTSTFPNWTLSRNTNSSEILSQSESKENLSR